MPLRRALRRTLNAAGSQVEFQDAVDGSEAGAALVFIDQAARRSLSGESLDQLERLVVIGDSLEDAEVVELLRRRGLNHLISDADDPDDTELVVTSVKLLSGDLFGLEKYLAWGVKVADRAITTYEDKREALLAVTAHAREVGARRPLIARIESVVDELLMNALYDAPVDENGVQVFAEIDPHDRTKTRSPRPVSIRYAATDTQFAVAVRDRFGRLAKNTILAYIDKCLHSPVQIDRKTYGAGLGLYLVANAAASYIVNVAYGIATEVVCTFDRGAKAPLRLVGVFVHPGGADLLKEGPTPENAQGRADVSVPTPIVEIEGE